jgi:hypothetical protein
MSSTDFQQRHLSYFLTSLLSHPFVRPQRSPSFRPDPRALIAAARRDRSRMAVAQAVQRAAAFPGHFLTGPSTAAGSGRVGLTGRWRFALSDQRQDDLRRACQGGRKVRAPRPCILQIPQRDLTMMQSCASAARLLAGRPILSRGIEAKVQRRVTATSDHLGIASRCKAGSTPNLYRAP